MKQVLFHQGKPSFESIPDPIKLPGRVLVEVTHSFISAGTEMSTIKSESGNFWIRALKQPKAIYSALKMVQSQGIRKTWKMVEGVRGSKKAIGYSCAGRVLAIGKGIKLAGARFASFVNQTPVMDKVTQVDEGRCGAF